MESFPWDRTSADAIVSPCLGTSILQARNCQLELQDTNCISLLLRLGDSPQGCDKVDTTEVTTFNLLDFFQIVDMKSLSFVFPHCWRMVAKTLMDVDQQHHSQMGEEKEYPALHY